LSMYYRVPKRIGFVLNFESILYTHVYGPNTNNLLK